MADQTPLNPSLPTPSNAAVPEKEVPANPNGRVTIVEAASSGNGQTQFALPIAPSAVRGIELVDVDLVVLGAQGERYVLPQAALTAALNPSQSRLVFADGSSEMLSDQLKKVGQVKPVEGGSFRVQATPLKPVVGVSESAGNDFNVGSDAKEGSAARAEMDKLVEQVQQLSERVQNAQSPTTPSAAEALGTAAAQGFGKQSNQTHDNIESSAAKPTVVPTETKQYDANAIESTLQAQLFHADSAKLANASLNLDRAFKAVQGSELFAASPLAVNVAGNATASNPTVVAATLELAPNAFANSIQISRTAGSLPLGLTINGSALEGHTVTVSDVSQLRLALSWNALADDVPITGHSTFTLSVSYLDATSKPLEERNYTFSHGDFRSAGDVPVGTLGLPARGWSYALNGSAGNDLIEAGAGHDVLKGGAGNDTLRGGLGDDTLMGGEGADELDGGTGRNTVSYENAAASNTLTGLGLVASLRTNSGAQGEATGDTFNNIQHLSGSAFADVLEGDVNANLLQGLAGNDTLIGGAGADTLDGGVGSNTASYANAAASNSSTGLGVNASLRNKTGALGEAAGDIYINIQHLTGSAFADVLEGDGGANFLQGLAGNDTLVGGAGADTLAGGDGVNTVSYTASAEGVVVNLTQGIGSGGDAQDDVLSNFTHLIGSAQADTLTGDDQNNSIQGGAGNDTLIGLVGNDTLDGGDGSDTVSYANVGNVAVTLDLSTGGTVGDAAGDVLVSIENVIGSDGGDVITGNDSANRLEGGAGADTLRGGLGADTLLGGAGNDSVEGGAGGDTIDGGADNNTVSYASASAGVTVNLSDSSLNAGSDAAGDVLINIQHITGSDHSDLLTGSSADNLVTAGRGNDILVSSAGSDTLIGGEGSDTLLWSTASTVAASDFVGANDARYQSIEVLDLRSNAASDTLTLRSDLVRALADNGDNSALRVLLARGDSYSFADETANGITRATVGDVTTFKNSAGVTIATVTLDEVSTPTEVTDPNQVVTRQWLHSDDYKLDHVALAASGQRPTDVSVSAMLAASPLQVQASGSAVAPPTGAVRASADLVLPGLSTASSATLTLQSASSALLAQLDLQLSYTNTSGVQVPTSVANVGDALTLPMSGVASSRITLSWRVVDDSVAVNPSDLVFGVQMRNVQGGQLSASGSQLSDLTFRWADVRSAAEMAGLGNDSAGNAKLLLAARGWSYELMGTAGNDNLNAGDGHDRVRGGAGADTLNGGRGDDTLVGGDGADVLDGGTGSNTASYEGDSQGVNVSLLSGLGSGGHAQGDTLANIVHITSGSGDDRLTGNGSANRLEGAVGNDTLTGGAGADTLVGGPGSDWGDYSGAGVGLVVSMDTRVAQAGDAAGDVFDGIENLSGSANADRLVGNASANMLAGGAGNDTLEGGGGADVYYGAEVTATTPDPLTYNLTDIDVVSYSLSSTAVTADLSDSTYNQGSDAQGDTYHGMRGLIGSAHADTLVGNSSGNKLEGGTGDDTLRGGLGADTLVGGEGSDWASYEGASGVTASLANAPDNLGDQALGDRYDSIENLLGSAGSDTLIGNSAKNILDGGAGDDVLVSNGGGDSLIGGAGKDTVSYANAQVAVQAYLDNALQQFNSGAAVGDAYNGIENLTGSAYADVLAGDALANVLVGGAGDDTLIGGAGADVLNGGAGVDTASYANAGTDGVTLDLATGGSRGDANGDAFVDIENVIGSDGADVISGNDQANWLQGGAGDDSLIGGGGSDTLWGGEGNDELRNSGAGSHFFDGGAGINTVSYDGFASTLNLSLSRTDGNSNGAGGAEFFSNIQNLSGGTQNDTLIGDGQANTLRGAAGNDNLSGLAGNDVLMGELGNDTLTGGAGADTLNGGDGSDTASYATSSVGVRLDLSAPTSGSGDAQGDVLIDIETIVGSAQADTFVAGGTKTDYTYNGGNGNDTVSFEASGTGVDVRLLTNVSSDGLAAGASYISIENLTGSGNADTLQGNASANLLRGGGGNDVLLGSLGANDTLEGGTGTGIDTADYSSFASGNALTLNLATLVSGYYAVQVAGGNQVDQLKEFELIRGSQGNDSLAGDASANRFEGGLGNDSLSGAAGEDSLLGGDGDDVLDGGADADTLDGGDGLDTASYASALARVEVSLLNLSGNSGDAAGDSYTGIENLLGSAHNDTLEGDAQANVLAGAAGNDTLLGGAGDDTLQGGANDDNLVGGAGSDRFEGGDGVDTVSYEGITAALTLDLTNTTLGSGQSTAGSDAAGDVIDSAVEIVRGASGAATTFLSGARSSGSTLTMVGDASQVNTVSYDRATSAVTATLNNGNAATSSGAARLDRFENIANLTGSNLGDTLSGDANANALQGGADNDTFLASAGNDTIYGGLADGTDTGTADTLRFEAIGSAALNLTVGASGLNSASWVDASSVTHTTQFAGIEVFALTAQADTYTNNSTTGLQADGLAGNDTLTGGSGNDSLIGGADNDSLVGGLGNDALTGGDGADTLLGGDGADTLIGGAGFDDVQGGAGADTVDHRSAALASGALVIDLANTTLGSGQGTGDAAGDVIDDAVEAVLGHATASTTFFGRDTAVAESMTGGSGNDTFWGSAGADTLDGGGGTDTVDYSQSTAVTIDLSLTTQANTGGQAAGDVLRNVEHIVGSAQGDSIRVGSVGTRVEGGAGNDTLTGGSGNDTLVAGDGNDSLSGSGGNDVIDLRTGNTGLSGDHAEGGGGDDTVIVAQTLASGSFTLYGGTSAGGSGSDTLLFHASASGALNLANVFSDATYEHFSVLDLSKDGVSSSVALSSAGIQNLVDNSNSSLLTLRLSSGEAYSIEAESSVTTTFGNNSVRFFNSANVQIAQVNIEYV